MENALKEEAKTLDESFPPSAEYSLQILHEDENVEGTVEYVSALEWSGTNLTISASWPSMDLAQTQIMPGFGSQRTTLPVLLDIPTSLLSG